MCECHPSWNESVGPSVSQFLDEARLHMFQIEFVPGSLTVPETLQIQCWWESSRLNFKVYQRTGFRIESQAV